MQPQLRLPTNPSTTMRPSKANSLPPTPPIYTTFDFSSHSKRATSHLTSVPRYNERLGRLGCVGFRHLTARCLGVLDLGYFLVFLGLRVSDYGALVVLAYARARLLCLGCTPVVGLCCLAGMLRVLGFGLSLGGGYYSGPGCDMRKPRSSKFGWALAVSDLLGGSCIPLNVLFTSFVVHISPSSHFLHSSSPSLSLQSPLIIPPSLAINLSKYTIIFIVRPPSAVYAPLLIVFPRSPLPHRAIPLVHPSTPFLFYSFFGVLAFFFSFGVCVWSGLCDNTLRLSSFVFPPSPPFPRPQGPGASFSLSPSPPPLAYPPLMATAVCTHIQYCTLPFNVSSSPLLVLLFSVYVYTNDLD